MKVEKIFYFASTHWDREWYKTVDEFRYMLIPVLDKVINTLQTNPAFKIFTLDGQTSVLEDYLTIRPEKREVLTKLIRDGRIIIGPWYTMPDEFLLSGESLIQNLLAGHRIASGYGAKPLKNGYVCDIFGHIANLPQILNGFGIDSALISRGCNDSEIECFFDWISPDGSRVLTFKAPETCGYGSFHFEVMSEFRPNYTSHMEEMTARAISYVERECTRTSLPYVILMDGMDHETIHEFVPEILNALSRHFNCPVEQVRLDEIPGLIRGTRPVKKGELAAHGQANVMHNKVIPHTLSSRYDLKRANDDCQNLLEHYALPISAIDSMAGASPITSYLDYAYSLLLQNHAHDSICGCSIDAVHREMLTRFEKAKRTANEFFEQFCGKAYQAALTSDGCVEVKLFNPLPYEYRGLLEFDIDFAPEFETSTLPYIRYEQRNTFLVYDECGQELPYNIIRAARNRQVRQYGGNKRFADPHRIALSGVLRPMGFTTFTVKPSPLPYRITDRFSTGPDSCENEYIRFVICSDGTITLTDKKTGHTYTGLHSFIDCCEAGDGWYHTRPIQDRVLSSAGARVSIEKIFDGYASCIFRIRYEWTLPEEKVTEAGFSKRSEHYVPFIITSDFTIARDSKLIRVHTVVNNTVRDHRLQLHLPTGIRTTQYSVNQCNLILSRNVGLDNSHYNWKEADITEYAFENLAFLRDDTHGLAFISGGGLHEISCPGDATNSMDITLMRCFSRTVGTDGEPDGELPGLLEWDYALLPLAGESNAELVRQKDCFVCGYRGFTIPSGKFIPEESAFTFTSKDCVYITCMSSGNNGMLIRAANYAGKESTCSLVFCRPVKEACLCDFLSRPIGNVSVSGNQVTAAAGVYQMINILVRFEG